MTSQHMTIWRECIRAWYPDYETKTYFVPPVVITRIPFDVVTVAGQSVLVPHLNPARAFAVPLSSIQVKVQSVQDSDTRDDSALQRVLLYLRELVSEKNELMFVISQLQFSNYLGKPCYAAAAKYFSRPKSLAKYFSRPKNLAKHLRRGNFDILVIHRHYGIITGEIKSILSNQQELQLSQPYVDRVVTDTLRNAIKNLNKSEVILREITKDLDPCLAIHKLLILPYVTADVLIRVVSNDEQLRQDLVTCLHVVNFEQALQCCLLAENLLSSGTETVNDQQQTRLSTFGASNSTNTNMTGDIYLDLLARFCGPATTVSVYCPTSSRIEIRTEGQGVAMTGKRMTSLVLTPEQISLLTRAPTKVWLTGPPGVGKSVMLVLIALTWLRQGRGVHLVSVQIESLAATRMIKNMIQVSMRNDPTTPSVVGSVHLHEYNFYCKKTDVDKAINTLTAIRRSHGPYIICDEFWTVESRIALYHRFVTELCMRLSNICLWAASPRYDQRPVELQEERLTTPLRCPPAVLSEVQKGVNLASDQVYPYTTTVLATPCDGPNLIHLNHQGLGHIGHWPLECAKCGQSIASILQRLGVGVMSSDVNGNINPDTMDNIKTENADKTTTCPSLQYRDVFVLTGNLDLRDDVKDETGRATSLANGVVRGLRAAGIPVHVIRKGYGAKDVYDTAVTQSNVVTVTYYGDVSGLERKVVVWLPGRIAGFDDEFTYEEIDVFDRLQALSRCTAQLVVVDVPSDRHIAVQMTKSRRRCCVS